MYEKQYYFDYKGRRYPCGTILNLQMTCNKVQKDVFECCIPEKKMYKLYYNKSWYSEESFYNMIVEVTNERDKKYLAYKQKEILNTKLTLGKEINCIDGLGLAWLWYVFLMAISFIFNGFYIYWIYWSVLFFMYRNHKFKQQGYRKINGSWYKLN